MWHNPMGIARSVRRLYFNRLAQRIGGALSVPTAQGALYEIDTRLRPQGAQGPLAVSLDSFARYQRQDAWTWEHMALCRARALTGSTKPRAQVAAIIESVLLAERDPDKLRGDVMAMRAEMATHKATRRASSMPSCGAAGWSIASSWSIICNCATGPACHPISRRPLLRWKRPATCQMVSARRIA